MSEVNWQKCSTFEEPQQSPGFQLWQTFLTWQRELNLVLQPLGLTQPQFSILAVVGWLTRDRASVSEAMPNRTIALSDRAITFLTENRTAIKQQDIADFMKMERMHVSQVVRKLEKMGYVERSSSVEDGRVQLIQLTRSGVSKLEEALPLVEAADAKFFSP